jgi:hypothetical protein
MSKKTSDKQKREPYLKISAHILNLPDIGPAEKMLLAHIESFGQKGCWQSNQTIAQIFMVSSCTIKRWLKKLSKYLYFKNPKGYYRTIWAKFHWVNIDLVPGQNVPSDRVKSALRLGQKCATTINNTITENYKRTTASPSPAPCKGASATLPWRGPSLLGHRSRQSAEQIGRFKSSFGLAKRYQLLSSEEFGKRRQHILAQLRFGRSMRQCHSERNAVE